MISKKLKFNKLYFVLSIILLIVEIFIGTFVHDSIIRPYIGDFLVVILIYCLLKSFFDIRFDVACAYVLIFSYSVEILQYFKIVEILHLQHIKIARIIIGTSFAWVDIIAYSAGIALVFIVEKLVIRKSSIKTIA